MVIKIYEKNDEMGLLDLLYDEGEEWIDYYNQNGREKLIRALASSIAYLAYEGNIVIGYIRAREDDGFGVYIYDLLVRKSYRGHNIGKQLMEHIASKYFDQTIYVMSDVDNYYEKVGYQRVGSIFEIKREK